MIPTRPRTAPSGPVRTGSGVARLPAGAQPRGGRAARGVAVAGTAAVVLSLGGGKWGAYLGLPPVYPIDVLLALAVGGLLIGSTLDRSPARVPGRRAWPGIALTALLGYALLRFGAGRDHSLVAVRDLAPYGYATAGFLAAWSYARADEAARRRTARLLRAALLFHLAWVAAVRLLPGLAARMPVLDAGQDLRLLGIRLASDGTVVGVTAALYLVRLVRAHGRGNLLIVLVSAVLVADMSTRAALLSTAAALAVAVLVCATGGTRGRALALLGLLPVLTAAVALALPHTTAGSKLLSGFGLQAVRSDVDATGIGTKEGRSEAWSLVIAYVGQNHDEVVGQGFGPDYLYYSGARAPLGNGEDLRAPHNFLVNTYARLGLVGLVLFGGVLVAFGAAAVRLRRAAAADDLIALALVLPAGFLVAAVVGVQLESPFGAVPFWWCLGVALSAAGGVARPRDTPPRSRRPATSAAPAARRTRGTAARSARPTASARR